MALLSRSSTRNLERLLGWHSLRLELQATLPAVGYVWIKGGEFTDQCLAWACSAADQAHLAQFTPLQPRSYPRIEHFFANALSPWGSYAVLNSHAVGSSAVAV